MHSHPGFNAAAAGAITKHDYRRLLSRLLGFHRPFEGQIRSAADRHHVDLDFGSHARSPFLVADLMSLGLSRSAVDDLPDCMPSLDLSSRGAVLGSLYVLEGSTLGGVQIARALQGRFGGGAGDALQFFLGRGDQHGALWAEIVALLETLAEQKQACNDAVSAALGTFREFERWMAGWTTKRPICSSSPHRGLSHKKV
jgi:heme oxygenase